MADGAIGGSPTRLRDELDRQLSTLPVATERDARVHDALARLGADDREVLRLSCWEQLHPAEIAVVLGISAVTARSRLHRARVRLRDRLGEVGDDRAGHQPRPAAVRRSEQEMR